MIKQIVALLILFLTLASVATAAPRTFSQLEVKWIPDNPEPDDQITVTVSIEETNVSGIILQVCVKTEDNYVCRIPEPMQEIDGTYTHSFYIYERAEVHLNLTIQYQDGYEIYDNSTSFKVETPSDDDGSTPGFGFLLAIGATGLLAMFLKHYRKKF